MDRKIIGFHQDEEQPLGCRARVRAQPARSPQPSMDKPSVGRHSRRSCQGGRSDASLVASAMPPRTTASGWQATVLPGVRLLARHSLPTALWSMPPRPRPRTGTRSEPTSRRLGAGTKRRRRWSAWPGPRATSPTAPCSSQAEPSSAGGRAGWYSSAIPRRTGKAGDPRCAATPGPERPCRQRALLDLHDRAGCARGPRPRRKWRACSTVRN